MMPDLSAMASAIATAAVDDSMPDFSLSMQAEGHWGATSTRRPNGDWVVVVSIDATRERLTFEYGGRHAVNPGVYRKPVKREVISG